MSKKAKKKAVARKFAAKKLAVSGSVAGIARDLPKPSAHGRFSQSEIRQAVVEALSKAS